MESIVVRSNEHVVLFFLFSLFNLIYSFKKEERDMIEVHFCLEVDLIGLRDRSKIHEGN